MASHLTWSSIFFEYVPWFHSDRVSEIEIYIELEIEQTENRNQHQRERESVRQIVSNTSRIIWIAELKRAALIYYTDECEYNIFIVNTVETRNRSWGYDSGRSGKDKEEQLGATGEKGVDWTTEIFRRNESLSSTCQRFWEMTPERRTSEE